MGDSLRLRQSTQASWEIDGLPGTTTPEAAAQMMPAIIEAMGGGGSFPNTGGSGTDGSTTAGPGLISIQPVDPVQLQPLTIDATTISDLQSVQALNISAVVISTTVFTQAVADIITANPNPFTGTPAQPTTPVLSPIPNGILVAWDGLNANGTVEKVPDWDHLEVHVSELASFTPTTATLKTTIRASKDGQGGQAIYATTRYGVSQYVRFVAVARSGASSTPSKVASAQPGQITSIDVGQFALTVTNFIDDRHHLY